LSANGAKYDSQGQATKSRRPWANPQMYLEALKGRNSAAETIILLRNHFSGAAANDGRRNTAVLHPRKPRVAAHLLKAIPK